MKAEEARKITLESKSIMDKINTAAFDGKNKITVDSLTDIVETGLRKLGYNIQSRSSGFNEYVYDIEW